MTILGINCGHDASICLIQQGVIVCAIEEEKMSRQKSEHGFPVHALAYFMEKYDLKTQKIDVIALSDTPYTFKSRLELHYLFSKKMIFRRLEQMRRLATYCHLLPNTALDGNRLYFENLVRQRVGSVDTKIIYYNHHLAHAASAFYTAPFQADVCITCDGRGEEASFNFYLPNAENGDLTLARMNDYSVSVGQVYSAVTTFLGFKANRHEGKIMGLAALGKPTPLVKAFKNLFFYENNKLHRLPKADRVVALNLRNKISFKTALQGIGREYALNTAWLMAWLTDNADGTSRYSREGYDRADIAFALQKMTEDVVLAEIRLFLKAHASVLPNKVKIALAGGVFANVRLNQLLFELPEVDNIFIHPAMSDAGLSLGAAVLAAQSINKTPSDGIGMFHQYSFPNAYIGADFTPDVSHFINEKTSDFTVQTLDDAPSVIAELLANDTIIGFYHGRMEWGPRALGNRSIIANPFRKEINAELNNRLNRTEFMPFAPSILDFVADEYLVDYDEGCAANDYMTMTYVVKEKYHALLQAVVHVDGTCRPHIVREAVNPYYYAVLKAFYDKTGCGAVVNTSFNVHEEPIVATPLHALRALKDKRIDVLVVENYLISWKIQKK